MQACLEHMKSPRGAAIPADKSGSEVPELFKHPLCRERMVRGEALTATSAAQRSYCACSCSDTLPPGLSASAASSSAATLCVLMPLTCCRAAACPGLGQRWLSWAVLGPGWYAARSPGRCDIQIHLRIIVAFPRAKNRNAGIIHAFPSVGSQLLWIRSSCHVIMKACDILRLPESYW